MVERTLPRRLLPIVVLGMLAIAFSAMPVAATHPVKPPKTVDVQILSINDFHGQLEVIPSTSSGGRVGATPAGGAAYLATHLHNLEATNPNTVIVAAGDLIGASPLTSALFHDEPTIEAMNLMGLDFSSVGNHEFDEGTAELKRMQNGGCHPVDGCQDGDGFAGANFRYLSANVIKETWPHLPLFPPYAIRNFGGTKVAFIGLVLEGTPDIVTPSGVAGYDFLDEAKTINFLIPLLRLQGAETIVVLIHEGGAQNVAANEASLNTCTGFTGAIADIVNATNDEVDLWISGHTHLPYNCVIDGDPVVSAYSTGRVLTDINLTIDKRSGNPTAITVNNVIVTRDVTPDPAVAALVAKYDALSAPLRNRVIGSITADITRTQPASGESALGDVIADGQLDATTDPSLPFGPAVVAFMNPGGIRTDLTYAQISGTEALGEVTYGEMFNVQPFGNSLVTMSLTGAQIERVLEEQFAGCTLATARVLQVSAGFTYQWSASGPACDKVNPATIMLNGVTVDPGTSYRVTVNSFLADGGDTFPTLKLGINRVGGDVDTDAFQAYFAVHSPVPPGPQNRIIVLP